MRTGGQRPGHRHAQTAIHAPAIRRMTTLLLLIAIIIYLNGCGSGGNSSAVNSAPSNPNAAQSAVDLVTAQKAFDGTPRTPVGFYVDSLPSGVTGVVATTHLKNSDLAGAPVGAIAFELCSDNLSQITAWSEDQSIFMGSYADLVDISGQSRYWELTRVPRTDVSARLRHRVFKCSYLNRANVDPATDNGIAGMLLQQPLDAATLRDLAEYLWHFTSFDNADHVVLESVPGGAAAGSLAHAIRMAKITRSTVPGECDRIDVLRWTHTANTASGAISRQLETLQTLRARRNNGVVELCAL